MTLEEITAEEKRLLAIVGHVIGLMIINRRLGFRGLSTLRYAVFCPTLNYVRHWGPTLIKHTAKSTTYLNTANLWQI